MMLQKSRQTRLMARLLFLRIIHQNKNDGTPPQSDQAKPANSTCSA